jgi:hypothetical protein
MIETERTRRVADVIVRGFASAPAVVADDRGPPPPI